MIAAYRLLHIETRELRYITIRRMRCEGPGAEVIAMDWAPAARASPTTECGAYPQE